MELVERIVVAVLLIILFILWVVDIEKRQKRLDRAKGQIEDLANTIADMRKETEDAEVH